jgi:hypothetical protein
MVFRRLVAAAVFAVVLLGLAAPASAASGPDAGAESRFVALANGARSANGLGGLAVSGDLTELARQHSIEMANSGSIYHSSNLGGRVSGWSAIAENVGKGPDPDFVHNLFMNSAGHRANILDGRFSQIGVGVAWNGNTLYVTEIFRQPSGAAPAPAPAPVRAAAPAPAPRKVAPPPPPPPPPPTTTTTAKPTTTTEKRTTETSFATEQASTSSTTGPLLVRVLGFGLIGTGVAASRLVRRRIRY